MTLEFLKDATNVVLDGPNGVGKSTIAQNIAHQALIQGHGVLFTGAGQLLGGVSALDSDSALQRRLRHYARPQLPMIERVGYLSYSNRRAALMFELISRRYQNKNTVVTTSRPFAEWREVFPNAARVVSLVDRLPHNAELVSIEGDSYPLKKARDRTEQHARQRLGGKALRIESNAAHPRPLIVEISRFWPPEVALAVFELIDDLRDKILAVHGNQIHELVREQRGFVDPGARGDARDNDQPL